MAGRLAAVAAVIGLAAFTGVASAAAPVGPDVSKMTLQAADFPGSHSAGKAVNTGTPTIQGFEREIRFNAPVGASKYRIVDSIAILTSDVATATKAYAIIGHRYSSKAYRQKLIHEFLPIPKGMPASLISAKLIKPRGLGVPDSSMEIGFVVKMGPAHLDLSIGLLRLDSVIVENVAIGSGATIVPDDARNFATLAASHIGAQLVPTSLALPTVTGTAVQGQTLTVAPNAWSGSAATLAYQWQRCDSSGANCVDVPGATAATYAVTSADVGTTLRANVIATNRFGTATASSAVTAVVS